MSSEILISFVTLSMLEIVLGIDNLVFIALVAENLPAQYRNKVRLIGLTLALGIRVAMLASLSWVMQLTEPLFTFMEQGFSFRDLLLIAGGVFLIGKSTLEIHSDVGGIEAKRQVAVRSTFRGAVLQIVIIDFVFSFDSIMTAVGIANNLWVMVAAVVVSMIVMLISSDYIGRFLHRHPTFKILALAFILMIGMILVAEGMGVHVPKGYVYFAFAFSILVESLNTVAGKKRRQRTHVSREDDDV